ncbi:FAD assembly factor SdhE [Pararhizobium haloflavum]|uniref:FAD assembly factor SdhE n=1 Tax=Pararhizobium haloflavum TaxID=2037914 RepID=UPI000C17D804|nr:succinate dehydrogenase assembly factor 2 [Pararhizobium haloflavum]
MTGTTMTSAGLDPRRRRLLFRAWHRGIREMDLVLGSFADREIAKMDEAELDMFERLLEIDDREMVKWVTGEAQLPPHLDTPLFGRIRAFNPDILGANG